MAVVEVVEVAVVEVVVVVVAVVVEVVVVAVVVVVVVGWFFGTSSDRSGSGRGNAVVVVDLVEVRHRSVQAPSFRMRPRHESTQSVIRHL